MKNLEKIKNKYPDYKAYLKLLKKMKFKRIKDDIGLYDNNVFMGVEMEDEYVNSNVRGFLNSKLIPKEGISVSQFESDCEEYLRKLPDFLNFLIKQL